MKTSNFVIFKVLIVALFSLFLILLLILGTWMFLERNSDPLSSIDIDCGKIELSDDTIHNLSFEQIPQRRYRHITLTTEHTGTIEAYISEPEFIPEKGLPVVIILGGLEVDINIFEQLLDPGRNIYVIFKYPYTPEYWYEGAPIVEIPIIRQSMLNVPSQALALYEWVSNEQWSERERVIFAGFSFGAMFLPAIYHLAESRDTVLNPGIIAYGGADISDLLYTNLEKVDPPWRSFLAYLGETAIYDLEPARYLPYMNNEFLLINGTRDHQISTYSWKKLHSLTPQPKTVEILDEGHMHPKKPDLTKKLVKISKVWLLERGLINH